MVSGTGSTGNVPPGNGGDKAEPRIPTSVKFRDAKDVRLVKAAAGILGKGMGAFIGDAAADRAREELIARGVDPEALLAEAAA